MTTFSREEIQDGLKRLGELDILDARRLMQEIKNARGKDEFWQSLEPYLVPGDELTAQYAFLDLWESLYGSD